MARDIASEFLLATDVDNLFCVDPEKVAFMRVIVCCDLFSYSPTSYANQSKVPQVAGVYVIIDGDEICYVGKSRNIYKRLLNHRFEYDQIVVIECEQEEISLCEIRLIALLCPQFNSETMHLHQAKTNP